MTVTSLEKLLCATLNLQQDDGTDMALGERRVREILSEMSTATEAEQNSLLRYPSARRQLYFIADVMRAEQLAQWQQSGIENVIQLKAAAQRYSDQQPIIIDTNQNFVVTLFPPEEEHDRWTIHLKMAANLITELKGIRLKDSSGQEWLRGKPDADGELSQSWNYAEDPLTVLKTQQLIIEPY